MQLSDWDTGDVTRMNALFLEVDDGWRPSYVRTYNSILDLGAKGHPGHGAWVCFHTCARSGLQSTPVDGIHVHVLHGAPLPFRT